MKMLTFDIDGVVADIYEFVIIELAALARCTPDKIKITQHDIPVPGVTNKNLILEVITQATVKYADKIQPYPGAIAALEQYHAITKEPIVFITARQGANVADATHAWVNRYLPETPHTIFFKKDKRSFLQRNTDKFSGIAL